MFQHGQEVGVSSGVAEFPPQQFEHSGSTLRVDVLLIEPSCKFPLIFVSNHLEELDVPVEGLVLVFSKFLDHWESKK